MAAKKKATAPVKTGRPAAFIDDPEPVEKKYPPSRPRTQASSGYSGQSTILFTHSFDGEKNLGEIGPIRSYYLNYERLRARSWQAMLESEIAQTVVNRLTTWVIGKGLKLQAEPDRLVLQSEGITMDVNAFSEIVEARFKTWARSRESDYSRMKSKNSQGKTAFKNAIVGGDVLIILRYQNKRVTVQLIDGVHVQSPLSSSGTETWAPTMANGNRIVHGVEISPSGEHVAYYVRKPGITFETQRIAAKADGSGLVMARLITGMEHRIDNVRGLPLLSAVLETSKKLERYKEATVGSAEERQKIAYTIEHSAGSDGDSPLAKSVARAVGLDPNDDIPKTDDGAVLADKIAVSTNKQVFNLGMEQSLKALESKNELYFKDFYTVNIDVVCAAIGIPPNVAMQKYDSNYSSSRAAIKDWEHTLLVKRHEFSEQFDQFIYEFWLATEIMSLKIQAPGFLGAMMEDNYMAMNAYCNARWVGANVPHIDPVKEVTAERLKLGDNAAGMPLTTVEAATEALNGGDSEANLAQFAAEIQQAKGLNIEPSGVPPEPPPDSGTDGGK